MFKKFLIVLLTFIAFSISINDFNSQKEKFGISDQQAKEFAQLYLNENYQQNSERIIIKPNNYINSVTSDEQSLFNIQDEIITNNSVQKKNKFNLSQPSISATYPPDLKLFGYNMFANYNIESFANNNILIDNDYILGSGDELSIYIWGSIQQNFNLTIGADGSINLPKAGRITIANLTFGQASELIKNVLLRFFANVEIEITVGKLRSIDVFILGEVQNPGRYSLSSMSNLLYSLYLAGGPTHKGSLRNIQIIRDKKVKKVIDLYDLFLYGDKESDIRLYSGDTVFVPIIGNTAAVKGAVKQPSIFEITKKTSLYDLITMSGKYTQNSYIKEINLIKRDHSQDKFYLQTLSFRNKNDFDYLSRKTIIEDGDIVDIKELSDKLYNWVYIEGEVRFPGSYSYTNANDLDKLLIMAGGFTEKAHQERIDVMKLTSFDTYVVEPIYKKDRNYKSVKLNQFDKVVVYSANFVAENLLISIEGEVKNTMDIAFYKGITLQDAIFYAGGLNLLANKNRIEIIRYDDSGIQKIEIIDIDKQPADNFFLQPKDQIKVGSKDKTYKNLVVKIIGEVYAPNDYTFYEKLSLADLIEQAKGVKELADLENISIVRQMTKSQEKILEVNLLQQNSKKIFLKPYDKVIVRKSSDYQLFGMVTLEGNVKHPGIYPLKKNDTLTSLIKRAGGFNDEAYIPGLAVYRKLENKVTETNLMVSTNENSILALEELADFNRLIIDYKSLFMDKNSKLIEDLALIDNDLIVVPSIPQEVKIKGAVNSQGSFVFEEMKDMEHYLLLAGSLRKDADKNEIFVVHVDGKVTKSSLGSFPINRGDTIYVPSKEIKEFDLVKSLLDFTQILFNVATIWKIVLN